MLYEINCDTCYGWIEIDGISLCTNAWGTPDLSPLYGTPEVRGDDRLLPGAVGVIAYRRRATVTRMSIPFVVTGQVDRFGVEYSDPYTGFKLNIAYLNANVLLPTNVGDGTRTLVWYLPDGDSVTAAVHVLGFKPALKPLAFAQGTLELSVPGGDLHL